eukprot:Em0016g428a
MARSLELRAEVKKSYANAQRGATGSHDANDLLHPGEVPAEEMVPGEALPVFLHDLKQLPEPAILRLDSSANQFVAGGEEFPVVTNVKAAVKLSGIDEVPEHSFIVVEPLISQVIPGLISCSNKVWYWTSLYFARVRYR